MHVRVAKSVIGILQL